MAVRVDVRSTHTGSTILRVDACAAAGVLVGPGREEVGVGDCAAVSDGSSTGSAAAVAARALPFALGTDVGGSVRLPAAWCGLTGLKPTAGAIPRTGVFPLSPTAETVGPLTRSAADAALLFALLRGPDGAPLPNDIGLGSAPVLAKVPQKTTDDTLRQWRVLSVPSSILAVVHLSGSMKMAIGDTTRIGLAVTASQVALDAFPAQARIGIWGFSKNRGENGASYAEYSPLERLDAPGADGKSHGDEVRGRLHLAGMLEDRV